MSCCGKSRMTLAPAPSRFAAPPAPSASGPAQPRSYAIVFEYVGTTALTATGAISGRRYRFEQPGARLQVDPRDRPGLARVPNLRFVR
jgi:hypothetical protein